MNIKKYYLYNVFNDLMPIYPIYLLMFQSKGISVFQISLLLAIWSIPAVVLEIPTGILADRWSRKHMIGLGELLKVICYFLWIYADGFLLYAIGFVFWGIGSSFQSGSEEALLYDSLKLQGCEDRFDLILGKGHFISGISNMIASLTGGLIGSLFGFQAALGLSILSGLITTTIVFTMKEVNLYKDRIRNREKTLKGNTFGKACSFLFHNTEIILLMLLAVFVVTTAGVLDEYDQLIAKEYGLTVKLIGIWAAIRFAMISIGSYLARGLRIGMETLLHKKDGMFSIGFLCLLASSCLILSGLIKWIGIMSLYGLYYLIMSAGEVLQEDYIQKKIDMEGRATIHSLMSLSKNLYGIFFYSCFGIVATGSNLHTGLLLVGIYIAIWTINIMAIYIVSIQRRIRV